MATPEARASQDVKLRASQHGMKMYRNNSGALKCPKTGRLIRFGLGNTTKKLNMKRKSSDEIGYKTIVITTEMVGKKVGVFSAIEIKKLGFVHREVYPEGSREKPQKEFMDRVIEAGGIAGFASCPEDVDRLLNNFMARLLT